MLAISAPHSKHRIGTTLTLGPESLRCDVIKDDFQAAWAERRWKPSQTRNYRTYWGGLHYIQMLHRDHPLVMRPGQQYRLTVTLQPDIKLADE